MTTSIASSAAPRSTLTRRTSPAIKRLLLANQKAMTDDPRFATLRRTERQLFRLMLIWHDPLTGYLHYRTRTANFAERLEVCPKTIERARRVLINRGLIIGYLPGDGHYASTYVIARSWDEAEQAAKLRLSADAPYFPELPDRSIPSLPPQRPADDREGQEQGADADTAAAEVPAEKERAPQRRRREPEPPRPTPVPAGSAQVLAEIDAARREQPQFELIRADGIGLARSELRRIRERRAAIERQSREKRS